MATSYMKVFYVLDSTDAETVEALYYAAKSLKDAAGFDPAEENWRSEPVDSCLITDLNAAVDDMSDTLKQLLGV